MESSTDTIPGHVLDAAHTLDRYFKERGIEDWALFGCCSRSMYDRTKSKLEHAESLAASWYQPSW